MSRVRLSLISSAGTALGVVLALGAPQAQAQFVCVGNANGATVPPATASGAGATATAVEAGAPGGGFSQRTLGLGR